ncbi:MAG: hypothetical protein K9K78_07870 [Spirochaetales bacterium]|nr:hypothetical protein [Spirochaetales bacterium]
MKRIWPLFFSAVLLLSLIGCELNVFKGFEDLPVFSQDEMNDAANEIFGDEADTVVDEDGKIDAVALQNAIFDPVKEEDSADGSGKKDIVIDAGLKKYTDKINEMVENDTLDEFEEDGGDIAILADNLDSLAQMLIDDLQKDLEIDDDGAEESGDDDGDSLDEMLGDRAGDYSDDELNKLREAVQDAAAAAAELQLKKNKDAEAFVEGINDIFTDLLGVLSGGRDARSFNHSAETRSADSGLSDDVEDYNNLSEDVELHNNGLIISVEEGGESENAVLPLSDIAEILTSFDDEMTAGEVYGILDGLEYDADGKYSTSLIDFAELFLPEEADEDVDPAELLGILKNLLNTMPGETASFGEFFDTFKKLDESTRKFLWAYTLDTDTGVMTGMVEGSKFYKDGKFTAKAKEIAVNTLISFMFSALENAFDVLLPEGTEDSGTAASDELDLNERVYRIIELMRSDTALTIYAATDSEGNMVFDFDSILSVLTADEIKSIVEGDDDSDDTSGEDEPDLMEQLLPENKQIRLKKALKIIGLYSLIEDGSDDEGVE